MNERRSPPQTEKTGTRRVGERQWQRLSITGLEADIAYFQAQMELIGRPESLNQKAQILTFETLTRSLGNTLEGLKGKKPKTSVR